MSHLKKQQTLYYLTLFLFVQYVLVTVVMMLFYDSGHRFTPELQYFVLDQNHLNDLGRSISFAGLANPSYLFYSITLGLSGIGILLLFGPSSSLGVWTLQIKTIAKKVVVYTQIILCMGILRYL